MTALTALTAAQTTKLEQVYDLGAKALLGKDRTEMARAGLMIQDALASFGLTTEEGLPLAEEALLRNGNHRYQYAPEPEAFVPFEDERDDFESELTDEDYLAGWGLTRAEALGGRDYPDYMSTWDSNDYEYMQEIVYN